MRRMASKQRVTGLRGLTLRLITPADPLYRASAEDVTASLPAGLREPWWGFAWPGSYGASTTGYCARCPHGLPVCDALAGHSDSTCLPAALAHYLQQRPSVVRGRRVLDLGTGCGISAIAAARAGASAVLANDIDPYALHATAWNARATFSGGGAGAAGALDSLQYCTTDLLGPVSAAAAGPGAGAARRRRERGHDVVLLGDMCYDTEMAVAVRRWLISLLTPPPPPPAGWPAVVFRPCVVLIGDPGRAGFKSAFQPPGDGETGQGAPALWSTRWHCFVIHSPPSACINVCVAWRQGRVSLRWRRCTGQNCRSWWPTLRMACGSERFGGSACRASRASGCPPSQGCTPPGLRTVAGAAWPQLLLHRQRHRTGCARSIGSTARG